MKHLVYITAATILLLPQLRCNSTPLFSKEAYLTSFEDFVSTVEQGYYHYEEKEWHQANVRFTELCEPLYYKFKHELSIDDQEYVDRLKGRYKACKAKHKLEQAKKGLRSLYNQGESFIEHLSK